VIPEGTLTVAGETKFVPVKVTGTTELCAPLLGPMEVRVGVGTLIVNPTELLVPLVVDTVTGVLPLALAAMVKVAVICVELTTLMPLTVIPELDQPMPVTLMKFVPVKVTGTAEPGDPLLGLMLVRFGGGGLTVKFTELLVPPVVVTETEPLMALAPMVNVAVICVGLTTLTPLTEIPAGTLIVAGETKFVPVKVTGTMVLCVPLLGAMEVRVGVHAELIVS
jgi:hypothetical protein